MNILIKEAINLIENIEYGYYRDNRYSSVYLFTTENIKGMLSKLKVFDKKILTVSASGDQIFNMLISGALDIDSYDVNYFTKYYFYLKEAAIRTLTYKEFFEFFFPSKFKFNDKVFDEKSFLKILPNIRDKEAQEFWLVLFSRYGGKELYYSNLFIQNSYSKNTYIECNSYLSDEINYRALQQRLDSYNYSFYHVNLFSNIGNLSNKKYDFIYLSNIFDKLHCLSELEYVLKVKEILSNLNNHLTNDGLIGVCYLYNYLDGYWDTLRYRNLCSGEVRHLYFKDNYQYENFNGIGNLKSSREDDKDALMFTLKRKK